MLMHERLANCLARAVSNLFENDGILFAYEAHETCINHRLALYLEESLSQQWNYCAERLFADIEFNRSLLSDKKGKMWLDIDESTPIGTQEVTSKLVRPDIVIHNRKNHRGNILWIEVKVGSDIYKCKADASKTFCACQQFGFQLGASLLIDYPNEKLWIWIIPSSGQIEEYEFCYQDSNIISCHATWKSDIETHPLLVAMKKDGKYSRQY